MCSRPLLCSLNSSWLILLPALSNVVGERVVRVRCTKQGLDREQDCADLQGRRPVICKRVLIDHIPNHIQAFFERTHSSRHPSRCVQGGRCWDGRSWSRIGSWEESWGNHPAGTVRGGKCHLLRESVIGYPSRYVIAEKFLPS